MEQVWINRILAGETQFFDSLVTPHIDTLRRTILGRVPNWADADDLLQRSLWKAYRHLVQFRQDSSFRTWLISIGLNEVRQHWREQQRRRKKIDPEVDAFTIPYPDSAPSPEAQVEQEERAQRVWKAVSGLPAKYRDVVVLQDLQELDGQATADALALSEGAAKSRLHRARQQLIPRLRGLRASSFATI